MRICGHPGSSSTPEPVAHHAVKPRSMAKIEGRAALIHALAHIELNAIDPALDICRRFAGMPDAFYRQWLVVAKEEALHFELLRDHLHSLGHAYGDFPAHRALWEMAEKTKHDGHDLNYVAPTGLLSLSAHRGERPSCRQPCWAMPAAHRAWPSELFARCSKRAPAAAVAWWTPQSGCGCR